MNQRQARLHIPKLLQSAQDQTCTNCGIQDGTVVAAHCNDLEHKGIGKKSHDCLTAWLCARCHDMVDGRSVDLSKEEKRAIWDRAFKRTVVQWFMQGVVK